MDYESTSIDSDHAGSNNEAVVEVDGIVLSMKQTRKTQLKYLVCVIVGTKGLIV